MQEAADAAASEVEALCKQIADAEEAAIQEKETAASAVEAMRSLQEKTAADAVSVQQKLESEFIAQCDKVQELQKSLEEAQQQLEARGGDVSVAEKAIADREAALEGMSHNRVPHSLCDSYAVVMCIYISDTYMVSPI